MEILKSINSLVDVFPGSLEEGFYPKQLFCSMDFGPQEG